MRVTTVTCDRCKKEINKDDANKGQSINLLLTYEFAPNRPHQNSSEIKRVEWCRACADVFQIIRITPKKDAPPPPPPPTVDDFIREIIGDEIANHSH